MKNAVGGKVKCLYNKVMLRLVFLLFFLQTGVYALGAQKDDHWYKVETKNDEKKSKNPEYYPYDSVEKGAPKKTFSEVGFWSLRPKLGLSGGFQGDKAVFTESRTDRFFINASVQFLTQPWYRVAAHFQLMQANSLFAGASLEFTPSRKRVRSYYGFGLAHLLVSKKQFSNLVEADSYYLTGNYGWEFLLRNQHGWNIELKAFWSGSNQALQVAVGYIIPF